MPAAERAVDAHFRPDNIRKALLTDEGRRGLQIEAMRAQINDVERRITFDVEQEQAGAGAGRSRWHPLEWTYRHACVALTEVAGELSDQLTTANEPNSKLVLGEPHITRWEHLFRWFDEMMDAIAERAGISRDDPRLRTGRDASASQPVTIQTGQAGWQDAEHLAAAALR